MIAISCVVMDHPRVCGEQGDGAAAEAWGKGSPPRVRGTEEIEWQTQALTRITPACAGNRGLPLAQQHVQGDHPRVCGEQAPSLSVSSWVTGSPPRVRGTVVPADGSNSLSRITPACAGNRIDVNGDYCPEKDHPRVCGEQGYRMNRI